MMRTESHVVQATTEEMGGAELSVGVGDSSKDFMNNVRKLYSDASHKEHHDTRSLAHQIIDAAFDDATSKKGRVSFQIEVLPDTQGDGGDHPLSELLKELVKLHKH